MASLSKTYSTLCFLWVSTSVNLITFDSLRAESAVLERKIYPLLFDPLEEGKKVADQTMQLVFTAKNPTILNSKGLLTVSLPIYNTGDVYARKIVLTDVKLGNSKRIDPNIFPYFLGESNKSTILYAKAIFKSPSTGSNLILVISGKYNTDMDDKTKDFKLSAHIVVPAPVTQSVEYLEAAIKVKTKSGTWDYTLVNNEPKGSSHYINSFSIDIFGPANIISTPRGWKADTDKSSYVSWYIADQTPPYQGMISPGKSLSGFKIAGTTSLSESTPYVITSVDIKSNKPSLNKYATISSPRRPD